MNLERRLCRGTRQLGIAATHNMVWRLAGYLKLLTKWNTAHNLTAVRDESAMVTRHVLDSLSAAPFVIGPRVADIGSGGGLPGVPLAIVFPELQVTLVESRRKPVQFLLRVCADLGLDNVSICENRAEEYRPRPKFDTAIARAVTTLSELISISGHLCAENGRIVALKGRAPDNEVRECVTTDFPYRTIHPVKVPGLHAQRHIVILSRKPGQQPDGLLGGNARPH